MSFGEYYPADSYWHRRDPRVKMGVLVVLAVFTFLETEITWQLSVFIFIGILFYTSLLPFSRIVETWQAFKWLLGLTFLVNLFFIREGRGILGLPVTDRGLIVSFGYFFRLSNLLLLGTWLLGTTESFTVIKGIEGLLSPFGRLLPVGDIALVLGISLRFFPLLFDEAQEITLAQRARGVSFKGSWGRKIKGLVSMTIPLFVSTLRRAFELAQAMEARGFVPGAVRSSLQELRWTKGDTFTGLVLFLLMVLVITRKVF